MQLIHRLGKKAKPFIWRADALPTMLQVMGVAIRKREALVCMDLKHASLGVVLFGLAEDQEMIHPPEIGKEHFAVF